MSEFELRLESDLRRLLNPIVAVAAPARRQKANRHGTDDARPGQPKPYLALVEATS